jgi:carboxyl-terminal processing protease
MKRSKSVRRCTSRVITAGAALMFVMMAGFLPPADSDFYLKINQGIDRFGRVYKDVATNYVDDIDPEKFMQAGIEGMLGILDPYSVYIDKEDGEEVDLLTSGKYGGIGVTIGVRDGGVRILNVMDGYSAQRQGMLPGDRFLEVDGKPVTSKKPDDVRGMTRGEPGTDVRVKVEREGEPAPLEFVLMREEIRVKNITYADFLGDGIAYIRIERFSRPTGEELRQAIRELKLKREPTGVVLDLRGNPGGLLDAAVDVLSKFVPRGTMVVRTKGRRADADKEYQTSEDPLLPSVPLVCLTDRGSASASEIVCGSLQDLDRALIVGTRTFGKGLVQTIFPLNDGSQLKITTARYYIPSGRSIQEIDYKHRDKAGVFVVEPDSQKREFKTAHGRMVFEHGGITPDSIVNDTDPGPMVRDLQRKGLIFKFANRYFGTRRNGKVTAVNDSVMDALHLFLRDEKYDFQDESATKVRDLKLIAEQYHYSKTVLSNLDALSAELNKEKERAFERYGDHITSEVTMEFAGRVQGERGRIEASLVDDVQLKVAVGMIKDKKFFGKKLKR